MVFSGCIRQGNTIYCLQYLYFQLIYFHIVCLSISEMGAFLTRCLTGATTAETSSLTASLCPKERRRQTLHATLSNKNNADVNGRKHASKEPPANRRFSMPPSSVMAGAPHHDKHERPDHRPDRPMGPPEPWKLERPGTPEQRKDNVHR